VSVEHATFTIERTYPVPPARVFAAWADPDLKARWFGGPGWDHELDMRGGGRETLSGTMESGAAISYAARYYDVVRDERIVYAYEMHMDGKRISVSLAAVELEAVDGGSTKLTLTEHGAYLDGRDKPATRQGGTESLLEALGELLTAA
jgi:uncharacterized protein YndB with AHSA1/START domain